MKTHEFARMLLEHPDMEFSIDGNFVHDAKLVIRKGHSLTRIESTLPPMLVLEYDNDPDFIKAMNEVYPSITVLNLE